MTTKPQHPRAFITEMKGKLLQEKKQLEKELSAIGRKQKGDYKPAFPDYGRQDEDNVAELTDFQSLAATEVSLEQRLGGVEAALKRIEEGSYGVTENGQLIPQQRLQANPAATSIVAQRNIK